MPRFDPPCCFAPAAPAANSITSPSTASPPSTATVPQPNPNPYSHRGICHAHSAATPRIAQFPGSVNSVATHETTTATIATAARVK